MWPCAALVLALLPTPRRATPPHSRTSRICAEDSSEYHAKLTLIRHGQSEWNLANRFTGWMDVDLTERGITEARDAGRLLADDGQQHDLVCTSKLRRAVRTACLVLSTTNQCWVPIVKDSRLNEQHSGALTGYNKRELADKHGVDQVMAWRRTFDCPPPALTEDDSFQRMLTSDERYYHDDGTLMAVPPTESLQDTCVRVQAMWEETVAPALRAGKNVMVVSHGNTLRALVKLVDNVSEKDSFHLDVPTACPIVYELDRELQPTTPPVGFWGSSDAPRFGRFLMSEKKVQLAQDAMRQQCVQDIAVTTSTSSNDPDAISTTDAWTAPTSTQRLVGIDGLNFNVREKPPSYFALESERIKQQAQQEITSMLETMTRQAGEEANGQQVNSGASSSGAGGSGSGAEPVRNGAADAADAPPPEEPSAPSAATLPACTLIILRHGYSEYNDQNRFTGWADVELSNRGREEARFAGSLLREAGVRRLERVYSSFLKRAIKTAWLALDELELQWVPIEYTWRLNERHYGALQGRPKLQCSEEYGVKQVQLWRRGVHYPPPGWDALQKTATIDRRYAGVPVPESESLADCTARLRPFLEEQLFPDMRAAVEARRTEGADGDDPLQAVGDALQPPTYVVASSENLIRALVAELEGLSDEEVPLLDIPYATPLVYQFDGRMQPIASPLSVAPLTRGYYLGDGERIKEVQKRIRESLVVESGGASAPCIEEEADEDEEDEEGCSVLSATGDETCFSVEGDGELSWNCDEPPVEERQGEKAEEGARRA